MTENSNKLTIYSEVNIEQQRARTVYTWKKKNNYTIKIFNIYTHSEAAVGRTRRKWAGERERTRACMKEPENFSVNDNSEAE